MRLRSGVILQKIGGEYLAAATGDAAGSFNGFIRNNESADFVYRKLQTETTEEEILAALLEEYDAEEDVLRHDLHALLEKLQAAGLLA